MTVKEFLSKSSETGMTVLFLIVALPIIAIWLAVVFLGALFYVPIVIWERWKESIK